MINEKINRNESQKQITSEQETRCFCACTHEVHHPIKLKTAHVTCCAGTRQRARASRLAAAAAS